MMKKQEKKCKHNFCESCLHVFNEQGKYIEDCNLDCFNLANLENSKEPIFCENCGQEINNFYNEKDFEQDLRLFESALNNKNIKVICYTAPSVRVALGDEFGFKPGENVQGKMISALKTLGVDQVFDMNLGADFTIIEEANEFIKRLETKSNLPFFTSCCPGWVNYATKVVSQYKNNLSTCKSPQQMFGAIINNYYAERNNLKSTDLFVVSIVPCIAKKVELKQHGINSNLGFDVDVAITTKELAKILKTKNIEIKTLPDSEYDSFFGAASGAGAIFGNTGGVMEAVLRTIGDRLSNEELKTLDYKMVRGLDGVRRAEVKIKDKIIKLAVVTGLKNVSIVLNELKVDPLKYHFIEVMACDGGCIGGPGQPVILNQERRETLKKRSEGLYKAELKKEHRKAHKNPAVIKVYEEYLGEVGGEKAHKLLHRKYN